MNPIHRRRSLASTLLLALPLCAASLGAQGYTIQTDTVLITWSDGIRTQMDIHYPTAAAPSRGWPGVLCSHGSGGNRGRIEAMAKHLARQGYMAFAYDIRPFGVTSTILNPPTFDASQERRVLDGAESFFLMENLYGTKFDYENLAAVGRSMGGGISLKLAAHSGRTLPLPLPNPLPYNPFVTKGPVLKAVATMIAPVRAVDARITANGDLFRSDTADAIQSTAPSQWWTWALAGNYQNIRAAGGSPLQLHPWSQDHESARALPDGLGRLEVRAEQDDGRADYARWALQGARHRSWSRRADERH
jgi:pimeloyl-ACP methyl ester carboxylesterase